MQIKFRVLSPESGWRRRRRRRDGNLGENGDENDDDESATFVVFHFSGNAIRFVLPNFPLILPMPMRCIRQIVAQPNLRRLCSRGLKPPG
jgi:hypothetical protein